MNLMPVLCEWLCASALLILAVAALRFLMGRRVSAKLRYALWAAVLVRLLIPVQLFRIPVPAAIRPGPAGVPVAVSAPSGAEAADAPSPAFPGDHPPEARPSVSVRSPSNTAPLSVGLALGGIWLAGSAVMAGTLVCSNLSFARRLRRVRVPLDGTDSALPVYLVNLPSPCLFGLVGPAIYVTPETAADPVMLRHVLAHEYTHFRHGDHIWNILRGAALTVHWWNPLVWLAAALSRRDCELACDEGALKRLGEGERISYGRTLLTLLTGRARSGSLLHCATTMTDGQKSVRERVERIACKPRRWLGAAVLTVMLAALACACTFGQAEAVPTEPPGVSSSEEIPEDTGDSPRKSNVSIDPAARVLPETPDLNRNGVPETLRLIEAEDGVRIEVWEDGDLRWLDAGDRSHIGWKAVFLCTLEGEDYLLRYTPYMNQGFAGYSYKLFTLEHGQETVAQENFVGFDINFLSQMHESFEPEDIAAFMDEINHLLAHSVPLLNTDKELLDTFEAEGRLYDSLFWLRQSDSMYTYDPSGTMLENLWAFQEAMESYTSIPKLKVLDADKQLLLLSYQDRQVSFYSMWDFYFTPYPEAQIVDLNGDGRDELVLILNEGHGTGIAVYGIYVFDADTLEMYDTANLTEELLRQIESTGDEEYFYLSGPGLDVAIPKSRVMENHPGAPVAEVIVLGHIIQYSVEDGRVFCELSCDTSGITMHYTGSVVAELEFTGSGFRCVEWAFRYDA